jgi:hypothetical protein
LNETEQALNDAVERIDGMIACLSQMNDGPGGPLTLSWLNELRGILTPDDYGPNDGPPQEYTDQGIPKGGSIKVNVMEPSTQDRLNAEQVTQDAWNRLTRDELGDYFLTLTRVVQSSVPSSAWTRNRTERAYMREFCVGGPRKTEYLDSRNCGADLCGRIDKAIKESQAKEAEQQALADQAQR